MEKTIEEKRAAVLAGCERVCPNKDDRFEFDWGWMKNWGDWFGFYGKCDNPIFVSRPPEYDEYGLFHNFPLAYRLLGLEARDAVAELREESDKYFTELKAERAKSAKLVEALEEIMHHHGYFYANGSGEYQGRGGEKVFTPVGKLILAALATHKEGAQNG